MIIKALDLIGFGKFHHRQIELGPRINIKGFVLRDTGIA